MGKSGQGWGTAVEPQWDAVFERLASRLYANDTDGYLALLAQVADLPLTTPGPRQRRRFYQGGSWLVRDDYGRAATVFDDLLSWDNLTLALRDETLKISLLGRWQQIYEALVLLCLELGNGRTH